MPRTHKEGKKEEGRKGRREGGKRGRKSQPKGASITPVLGELEDRRMPDVQWPASLTT